MNACKACGSDSFHEIGSDIGPACTECGFVASVTIREPASQTGDSEISGDQEARQTWRDFSTVTNSTEARLVAAFEELERLADHFGLSWELRERAARQYVELAIGNQTAGRPTSSVIGAVLILSTRNDGHSIPVARVAEQTSCSSRALHRLLRSVSKTIAPNVIADDPRMYLRFLSEELDMSSSSVKDAESLLDKLVESKPHCKRTPVGYASASLYLASDQDLTQRSIADAAGISTETVRVCLKECREVSPG